ncbi:methyl-accepting chemotaxis protein [Acinetobacter rathckeae]|uniref:methyl-accepting chemotaxis protein n=1 Tax=Acinetobacter rathckeae TaxID=2605272 RepID=UPI0018A27550|nr:methyl-accepting chemotaxis protein [Acinetobacter rathckeae]MBF7688423.1 methyl-accepting chemotaxis protein [Acinetobacter rathckeae]MBF7695508.1 methyl-accepting chemotaxis protein [Acinetobacter rathckeae]
MGLKSLASGKSGIIKQLDARLNQLSHGFGDSKGVKTLLLLSIFSIVGTLLVLLFIFYSTAQNNTVNRSLADLKLISQVIPKQVTETNATGADAEFQKLRQSRENFDKNLTVIDKSFSVSGDTAKVQAEWYNTAKNLQVILDNKPVLNNLRKTVVEMDQVVPSLQFQYNALVKEMVKRGLPTSQVNIAKDQVVLAERMLRSMHNVTRISQAQLVDPVKSIALDRDEESTPTTDFQEASETFANYLNAQIDGETIFGVEKLADPELRASLSEIKKKYDDVVQRDAQILIADGNKLLQVQKSSNAILADSDTLLDSLNELSVSAVLTVYVPRVLLIVCFLTFIIALAKLFKIRSENDQLRLAELKSEYDQNQTAILRLLDEIADLADGDLRHYATVSEDFTGAIADSINFAIDQLRDLVSRINETSQEVSQYSQNTQHVTTNLTAAAKKQSDEISTASVAIREIVASIGQVSNNATESTEVAQRSVKIASTGADVVNRSMQGMDTIREQIQETSKRIKRLGESSQEIGNIISLINDIADQTNILALNAAIQASMAGEAGRGFAVVADEVQRLAERSASATKQIEGLVRTIQSDTNEAVISMEHTTTEVVRGANLAKDAGIALDEIQTVSNTLAQLIGNISQASQQQSVSANQIENTMTVVQSITTQTTAATFDTARSVSELANMAESLRASVTDFKLPEKQ